MKLLILLCALLVAEAAKLEGYVSQPPDSTVDLIPRIPNENFPVAIDIFPIDSLPTQPEQLLTDEIHSFTSSGQPTSGQGLFSSLQHSSNPGQIISDQPVSYSEPVFTDQSESSHGSVFSDQTISVQGPVFSDQLTSGPASILSDQPTSGPEPLFYDQTKSGSGQEIHGHDLSSPVSFPFDPSSAQVLSGPPELSSLGNSFVNEQTSPTFSNTQFSGATNQVYTPPTIQQSFDSLPIQTLSSTSGLSASGNSFGNEQTSSTFSSSQFSGTTNQVYTPPTVQQSFDSSPIQALSSTSGLSASGNSFVNEQTSPIFSNSQFSDSNRQTYRLPSASQQFDSSSAQVLTGNPGLSVHQNSFVDEETTFSLSNSGFLDSTSSTFPSPAAFQPTNTQDNFGQDFGQYSGSDGPVDSCPEGQVRHVDGRCVTPEISRHVFVYSAPEQERKEVALPKNIPAPKVEHNIVFIRTPDSPDSQDPIIVPPPQKKHIIYVLNKESETQGPKIIEVPAPKYKSPEVYFVNYADGENPTLPGGIDFETALSSAVHSDTHVISSGDDITHHDGGNAIHSGLGITSEFGDGEIGTIGDGFNIVSEQDFSGENFLSISEEPSTFVLNSGNDLTFPSNDQFPGSISNDISGTIDVRIPQQLYSSP